MIISPHWGLELGGEGFANTVLPVSEGPPLFPRSRGLSRRRVLICDDDLEVRQTFARSFRHAGYEVDVASDGMMAVQAARNGHFDAIVLDYILPGTNGEELAHMLRKVAPQAVYVLVSGHHVVDADTPTANGAWDARFGKPLPPATLVDSVSALLRVQEDEQQAKAGVPSDMGVANIALIGSPPAGTQRRLESALGAPATLHATPRDLRGPEGEADLYVCVVEALGPIERGWLRRLRDRSPKSALIAVIGEDSASRRREALLSGAHECVDRLPDDDSALVDLVKEAQVRRHLEAELSELAYRDALTGLVNRRRFLQNLEHCVAQSRRTNKLHGLLFIDLDGFKSINDTFGHETGDLFLQEVAERIRKTVREVDIVARMGGDEFAVLADDLRAPSEAIRVAARICANISEPLRINDSLLKPRASVGIAYSPLHASTADELIRCADLAMYWAKAQGKDTVRVYEPTRALARRRSHAIETQLAGALKRDEYRLVYQPQVNPETGRVESVEALLRWTGPNGVTQSPGEFLPVLESTGLIREVGAWVLRNACTQLSMWHQMGAKVRLAVNMSGVELGSPDTLKSVQRTLRRAEFPPQFLEIELTETALVRDFETAKQTISALDKMGVRLIIDDFGVGYSNLRYVRELPIAGVKLDRSFVEGLPGVAADVAVTDAVFILARGLDVQLVVEGVERAEQRDYLVDKGCSLLQGYLFGRPVSADEITRMLKSQRS